METNAKLSWCAPNLRQLIKLSGSSGKFGCLYLYVLWQMTSGLLNGKGKCGMNCIQWFGCTRASAGVVKDKNYPGRSRLRLGFSFGAGTIAGCCWGQLR